MIARLGPGLVGNGWIGRFHAQSPTTKLVNTTLAADSEARPTTGAVHS